MQAQINRTVKLTKGSQIQDNQHDRAIVRAKFMRVITSVVVTRGALIATGAFAQVEVTVPEAGRVRTIEWRSRRSQFIHAISHSRDFAGRRENV